MRRGFYKHKESMDCFIEILRVQYQDSKRVRARVRWWCLGFTGNPWPIRENDPIVIDASQFNNWIRFDGVTR